MYKRVRAAARAIHGSWFILNDKTEKERGQAVGEERWQEQKRIEL